MQNQTRFADFVLNSRPILSDGVTRKPVHDSVCTTQHVVIFIEIAKALAVKQ
ncbi:MAG: hypothetical protein KGJ80_01135 [Chloroflexota bacterium]|nr:hypothetical protein [Chloroflexota bacterium]